MKRLSCMLLLILMTMAVATPLIAQSSTVPCTFVLQPDTQYYSASYPGTYDAQTQWVVDNKVSKNIAYVFHEGDLTDGNSIPEWTNAQESMGRLDSAQIPYLVVPGNHDFDYMGGTATANFSQYFSPTRFLAGGATLMPTFAGVKDAGKMDNNYHKFTACGIDWLAIGVEFGPRADTISWLNTLVSQNPDRRVIIVTHGYMYNDESRQGSNPGHVWLPGAGGYTGQQMWDSFVKLHQNIMFVFSGHVVQGCPSTCDPQVAQGGQWGSSTLISTGNYGNKVYQFYVNYQFFQAGGEGFLRYLTLDPVAKTVTAKTYSPTYNCFLVDTQNDFVLKNVDLTPAKSRTKRPPLAVAGPDRMVIAGMAAKFDGSGSVDPDGNALTYTWTFNDGTRSPTSGMIIFHTFPSAGSYTATLTVNGSRGTSSTSTAGVQVLNSNMLFVDDFSLDMSQWSPPVVEVPGAYSHWIMAPGGSFLAQVNSPWGGDFQSNGLNKPGTYVLAGNVAWTNYSLKATLKSANYNAIGLMFRYVDAGNYYRFSMNRNFGYFDVTKVQNGVATTIAKNGGLFVMNQSYQIEIQVVGGSIKVFSNGSLSLSGIDPSPIRAGKIGLYDWANGASYFDNVIVSPL
jgi:hypothetical protein